MHASQWVIVYIIASSVVVMITGLIIPQILLIAFRKNLFDELDPRKVHKGAVPRLGGIAFFPAILFSMLLLLGVGCLFAPALVHGMSQCCFAALCFVVCAVIVLYLVGMADDLIGLRYRAKFIAQLLSASLVLVGGIYVDSMHGMFGLHNIPFLVSVLLTILLIVFVTNAVNLIDGIDGLASGISAVACVFYGYVFFCAGLHIYGLLAFSTLGALVSFFYYNVFGDTNRHKKIFMGDTGALTIGILLSVFSIRISQLKDAEGMVDMAVVAFAPLLIPCLDVLRVYFKRLREHRNPFLPDNTHIHHKLLALGIGPRVAMVYIVAACLVVTLLNCWLSKFVNINLIFFGDIALWIVVNMLLSRWIKGNNKGVL